MIANGEGLSLLRMIGRGFYSNQKILCLRRDLEVPFKTPAAKIALSIRPLLDEDVSELLESGSDVAERLKRKLFLKEKVPTCYVAVTEDGHPCYMQWLMLAEQNKSIQAYFKGVFPRLKQNEGLLEFAFCLEKYRGMGIMQHSMAEIATKGKESGARWIITFVRADNIPSLKGCNRAGFSPYLVHEHKWRFFFCRSEVRMLPTNAPHRFGRASAH